MGLEVIVILVVAVIAMSIFGVFRRRKDSFTRRGSVNSNQDIRSDGDAERRRSSLSPFKSIILTLVSLAAGFALSGVLIEFFIQPEVGPIDPWEPMAIGMYLVLALVIYGILRLFVRN